MISEVFSNPNESMILFHSYHAIVAASYGVFYYFFIFYFMIVVIFDDVNNSKISRGEYLTFLVSLKAIKRLGFPVN